MTDSANLALPFIEGGELLPDVTLNEALRLIDTLVQLAIVDRDLNAPPGSPAEGQRWIVKASPSPTGVWTGHGNHVAAWQDGGWIFSVPKTGWLAYVLDESVLAAWSGTAWVNALDLMSITTLQNLALLGVGTTADSTNPLSAKLNNALFTAKTVAEGGDGNLRYKLSKEAAANTLSFLFQDNFSGRAEIGLTGDDDFHFKVSSDGSTWVEALVVDRATGGVRFRAAESNVASAATCDIGAAASLKVAITGTTTITSFSTAPHALRIIKFAGALTLTHDATALVLPGAANIATAANDRAIAVSDGSGNWYVVAYQRANGKPVIGPAATDITDSTSTGRALLTAADAPTARAGISAAQLAAMATHNVAINGAVDVSQELGTAAATLTNNTAKYTADMFEAMYNHGANTAVVTSAQLASSSFPSALSGFSFGHQIKATTAITSPASGDFAKHRQKIEGYRIARWGFGAAGASPIVVAFRLYSTASGTAFVKLSNSDQSRCLYHEINVAAGWNVVAFSVAGDTTGTWQATTSTGLTFELFVSGKETTPASSLDAWGTTNKVQTTNATNLLGTNNNLTILTGLYIDAGTQLPAAADLPLLMRTFDQEVALCMRYYEKSFPVLTPPAQNAGTGIGETTWPVIVAGANNNRAPFNPFTVRKRISPTLTFFNPSNTNGNVSDSQVGADGGAPASTANERGLIMSASANASSVVGNYLRVHWTADARL